MMIALTVPAAGLAQIEDPTAFPGVWYRIALDNDGNLVAGDGDGEGWHYYATSDRYRMWFYNGPYDVSRKGRLEYWLYIKPVDPGKPTYADINFGWATAEWSRLGRGGPPLPGDVPTTTEEADYIAGAHLHTVDNVWGFESIEPVDSCTIDAYNPEWVSIDITGRNAYIYRGAFHECLPKDSSSGGGGATLNVCCRRSTGDCYTVFGTACQPPYEALPAGSTCADCAKSGGATLDFGDAPDPTYPTFLASDGARHTIVAGIFLGKGVDAESDGRPNATATGDEGAGADEDGVVFTSLLQPGRVATIDVTASTPGYLNAWIDFDFDGSFAGPGEQIALDEPLVDGVNGLVFDVPAHAIPGVTFARFRFNSRGLLSYHGPAADGEVEDYQVRLTTRYALHPTSGVTSLKWNQPPEQSDAGQPGVLLGPSMLSSLHLHEIVADDWRLEDERPITGVHWWGGFEGWTEPALPSPVPVAFHLAVWTDDPDLQPGNPNTFNHPGTLIWETYCINWTWALAGYETDAGGRDAGAACFQFSYLLSQDEWFCPDRDAPADGSSESAFYWLSISALYDPKGPKPKHVWGWKTRPHRFSESATLIQEVIPPSDSAAGDPLWGPWPPVAGSQWLRGRSTQAAGDPPLDMAFQLTTYGPTSGEGSLRADLNFDGVIDIRDLAILTNHWLEGVR